MTGVTPDGRLVEEIPGSGHFAFGENESGFLPADQVLTVEVRAIDAGTFRLHFDVLAADGSGVSRIVEFTDVPVSPRTRGTFVLSPSDVAPVLHLDVDGNGTVDAEITPNEAVDLNICPAVIRDVVRGLGLKKRLTRRLFKQVMRLERKLRKHRLRGARRSLNTLRQMLRRVPVDSADQIKKVVDPCAALVASAIASGP